MAQAKVRQLDVHQGAARIRARGTRCAIGLKRAYEPPSPGDGMRVLVDRPWLRCFPKMWLAIDFSFQDAAPSEALRRWYGHNASRWEAFAAKYRAELAKRTDLLHLLDELRRRGPVTLLYCGGDPAHNNAVVLRDVLEEWRGQGKQARKKAAA